MRVLSTSNGHVNTAANVPPTPPATRCDQLDVFFSFTDELAFLSASKFVGELAAECSRRDVPFESVFSTLIILFVKSVQWFSP
mmetsp:Transcript_30505/g.51328  ORF Transcript_30505/g.51328 Transcript_30505/m.51328 type:complete len:83 (-) Transcript_30505:140-388(-)